MKGKQSPLIQKTWQVDFEICLDYIYWLAHIRIWKSFMKKKTRAISTWICLFFLPLLLFSQTPPLDRQITSIDQWLILGPFTTPLPALHDQNAAGYSIEGLIQFRQLDLTHMTPKSGDPFKWHDGANTQWMAVSVGEEGLILTGDRENPSIAYLGVYLDVKRFTRAKLILQSPQAFRICINGKTIATKTQVVSDIEAPSGNNGTSSSTDLVLETGKHFILVKTAYDPGSNSDWSLKGHLLLEGVFAQSPPGVTLQPQEVMTISHLLDGPKVVDVSISPGGEMAALSMRQTLPPSDDSETWIEIYDLENNRLVQTYRGGMSMSSLNWAPSGRKFSYTTHYETAGTIWIVDMEKGTTLPLVKGLQNLGSHTWAPDESYLIYTVNEKGEEDRPGIKQIRNMADRQSYWRDRSYLYRVSIPDGVRQRLTAGEFTTSLSSISPDGKKVLFTRSLIDYSQRPFSTTELHLLDLDTLKAKLLWQGPWFSDAQWAPDGERLLILGGPSLFGNLGHDVIEGVVPNEYDTQAYILDLNTMEAISLTKRFNPSINQAQWCEASGCIFITATDRSTVKLFKYDVKKNNFLLIDTETEVVSNIAIARNKPMAVYLGSGAATPPMAFVINLEKSQARILKNSEESNYSQVRFGRVSRWTFKNREGTEIEGRVYFPPNFNPQQKYPLIVNYYGGTTPVSRSFGGRYPLNLYAAQGYVVYVLQPSGAIGFGQGFSARHVNDWGIIVADEIIDGVKKFISAHPFVDPKRVGCIGASYGGFMTMLLQTRTDMFAAAIAHAGISSISSYWGEGFWGYSYSAYATADSYPWSRKDIYVAQSPLFNADKISTPLLLLHGSVDTNVPPGESTQLFTALKLLGREVEYIQILDQDHHILTYNKRILWTKTILAWFDRWLKREPEWWQHLYPNKH